MTMKLKQTIGPDGQSILVRLPRIAADHESVTIEFVHTGQIVGPYRIDFARKECAGSDYKFYDLNGEVCQ